MTHGMDGVVAWSHGDNGGWPPCNLRNRRRVTCRRGVVIGGRPETDEKGNPGLLKTAPRTANWYTAKGATGLQQLRLCP